MSRQFLVVSLFFFLFSYHCLLACSLARSVIIYSPDEMWRNISTLHIVANLVCFASDMKFACSLKIIVSLYGMCDNTNTFTHLHTCTDVQARAQTQTETETERYIHIHTNFEI